MQPVKSLKRIVNHLSLKLKLFILLILLSIIPIFLVSGSSELFMYRSSTSYSALISSQYMQFVAKEVSGYLQNLNQSFDNLFTDQNFQKYVNSPAGHLSDQADHILQFRSIIQSSLQFHPEVLGTLYLDRAGKVYFESYQKRLNPDYSFEDDPMYQSLLSVTSPRLLPPHPIKYISYTQDRVFSYVRPIINVDTGETMSWFVIEIREDQLTDMLGSGQSNAGGQLVLYHTDLRTAVSGEPLNEKLLSDFLLARADREPEKQSHFLFASAGKEYEASYTELSEPGWGLIWMAPLDRIKEGAVQTFRLTLLIAGISLAAALIMAFPVMNKILQPLYNLHKGMKHLGRGQYVPVPEPKHRDEIGFLIQSYNQTLVKLQDMEREVYQSKMKEKERELLQLQAQINPHFLFNTLETIESYAIRNNGEAVGEMVQSVSRMMRYTVRNDSGWASLEEEIGYIRNFLTIHYYRNGRDVRADFDIAPEALSFPVMKLSIQPYVENAIKYGWSPAMGAEEFLLRISVEPFEEYLRVRVYNTGMGIPEEVLEKLHRMIESGGETEDPFFKKHTGIYNAYRRFVIVYGEQAYFRIDSSPEEGTCVEFHLPARREAE